MLWGRGIGLKGRAAGGTQKGRRARELGRRSVLKETLPLLLLPAMEDRTPRAVVPERPREPRSLEACGTAFAGPCARMF